MYHIPYTGHTPHQTGGGGGGGQAGLRTDDAGTAYLALRRATTFPRAPWLSSPVTHAQPPEPLANSSVRLCYGIGWYCAATVRELLLLKCGAENRSPTSSPAVYGSSGLIGGRCLQSYLQLITRPPAYTYVVGRLSNVERRELQQSEGLVGLIGCTWIVLLPSAREKKETNQPVPTTNHPSTPLLPLVLLLTYGHLPHLINHSVSQGIRGPPIATCWSVGRVHNDLSCWPACLPACFQLPCEVLV